YLPAPAQPAPSGSTPGRSASGPEGGGTGSSAAEDSETLWTYPMYPEANGAQAAMAYPSPPPGEIRKQPFSWRSTVLCCAGGLLFALAGFMGWLWWKANRPS
ncbi:MAG: hypothetical protein FWH26_08995, partial [Oscillospiraceae bacterium]|nr:hypothetical protein [Oscillospiraceae bacterium]